MDGAGAGPHRLASSASRSRRNRAMSGSEETVATQEGTVPGGGDGVSRGVSTRPAAASRRTSSRVWNAGRPSVQAMAAGVRTPSARASRDRCLRVTVWPGAGCRAHHRCGVDRRVRPDMVEQFAAAQGLAFDGGRGHRSYVADPVRDAVAEAGGAAARGECEERGVEEGAEMADLQLAVAEPAAVDEDSGPPGGGPRPGRPPPSSRPAAAAPGGQQHVEAGCGRTLGVHDAAVGEIEGPVIA